MFTLSVSSFQAPATPGTSPCAPSFPSTPTSLATLDTSPPTRLKLSTVLLTVSDITLKSPATGIANFSVKLPLEILSSILPISSVNSATVSIKPFKESIISFQLPATPCTDTRSVSLPSVPATFATRLISFAPPPTISAILLYESASSPYISYLSFGSLNIKSPFLKASIASNKRLNCLSLYSSSVSPLPTFSPSTLPPTSFSVFSSTSSNKAFLPGFLILSFTISYLLTTSAIFLYATPALHFGL
uniref:Uncharacterized protein n=1 Tax=Candidatus Methanophaga sp. ANME-1 ERB7 TaxID=2759913 RepID=A0A7G9Z968_9EURY|nr:hypothetical protein AEDKGFPA_00025 [Methanosarcinales archaeon ANME-1 ERB7]